MNPIESASTMILSDFAGLMRAILSPPVTPYRMQKETGIDKNLLTGYKEGHTPKELSRIATIIAYALRCGVDTSPFQRMKSLYDFGPTQTYEVKLELGPPDLSWLTRGTDLPHISTKVVGMMLDSPIGVASGPLMGNARWSSAMLELGYGLSSFKTRRSGPHQAYDPPLIVFVNEVPELSSYDPAEPPETVVVLPFANGTANFPPPKGCVNSMGVPSEPTMGDWMHEYDRLRSHPRGGYVAVSIMGDGENWTEVEKDFMKLAEKVRDLKPPAVELNLSCPNLEKKQGDLYKQHEVVADLCRRTANIVKPIPVIAKLPRIPVAFLTPLVKKLGQTVQAISYGNTIRVRPVRVADGQRKPAFPGREFGGLSGPCTYPTTLEGIRQLVSLRENLHMDFELIATGGISNAGEVRTLLAEGAVTVQACTQAMFDPLLAWKVRFELDRCAKNTAVHRTSSDRPMIIAPIEDYQEKSFKNAKIAFRQIRRRHPEVRLPEGVLYSKFNEWMTSQVTERVGVARQVVARKARSVDEWVSDFSKANR